MGSDKTKARQFGLIRAIRAIRGWLFAGMLLGAACHPDNPLDERVSARTPRDYTMWRARIGDRLDAAQAQELDAMVEEIRIGIMTEGKVSGSDAIDEALRGQMEGRTLRAVLVNGYGRKWQRLDLEKVRTEEFADKDARLRFKPGDEESRAYIEGVVGKMKTRLAEIALEMEIIDRRLNELGAPKPVAAPRPEANRPEPAAPGPPDEAPQLVSPGH